MTAKKNNKQNISLIIGLAIPVAMILFIAIAINAPRWFSNTDPAKYDFLYTTGQANPFVSYSVDNGRLIANERPVPENASTTNPHPIHFFIHDVSENSSREIPVEEALSLSLDGSNRSPDGFKIVNGRRSGWFIFGYSRSSNDRYLVNDSFSEKLDLETSAGSYNYYWNFRLLGWVTSGDQQ